MTSRVRDERDRAIATAQRRGFRRSIWRRPSAGEDSKPISMFSTFSPPSFTIRTKQKQFDLISSSVSTLPFENREQVRSWKFGQEEARRERTHSFFRDGCDVDDVDGNPLFFFASTSSPSSASLAFTASIPPPPKKKNPKRSARSPSTPPDALCSPSTGQGGESCSSCAEAAPAGAAGS